MPPVWQFAVSIGLMVLSIWAMLWFSSRLYRVGILMYGKRATLPELCAGCATARVESAKRLKSNSDHRSQHRRFTFAQRLVLAVVPRLVWALFSAHRPHLAL